MKNFTKIKNHPHNPPGYLIKIINDHKHNKTMVVDTNIEPTYLLLKISSYLFFFMIFNTIKELIEQQSSCPICGHQLTAFLKERARNKENIPQKKIHLINSKFKKQQFEFKLDYNRYDLDIHYQATLNDSNILFLDPQIKIIEVEYTLSFLSNLFLNIEMHCFNRSCKNKYYTITSVLKPQYDSNIGIYFHPFLLDWECFNINHLWIQNDHISQVTRIYNVDSINTPPIVAPFLPICVSNKEKTFNRIQTIVNFQ